MSDFNPYGLHSIHIPIALFRYPRVSWPAKVLYARLALFLGKKLNGFCRPSLETLATEMRVSADTIERWLAELVEHNFIRRQRRKRKNTGCIFLPHPCLLDSANLQSQEPFDSANLPNQDRLDSANLRFLIPQICGINYKEENIHLKHTRACASDDAQVDGAHAQQEQPTEPERNGRAVSESSRRPAGSGLIAQQKIWFDAWWLEYWRKKDRKRAWEAFQRKVKSEPLFERIRAATRAQAPEMLARDPSKRPHGCTWLNNERWEDEVDQPAKLPPSNRSFYPPMKTISEREREK